MSNWKEELTKLLKQGCTDSDIEDFGIIHSDVNGKEIWDYVFEYNAPETCKGCKHIQRSGLLPCNRCSRRIETKDYYEPR